MRDQIREDIVPPPLVQSVCEVWNGAVSLTEEVVEIQILYDLFTKPDFRSSGGEISSQTCRHSRLLDELATIIYVFLAINKRRLMANAKNPITIQTGRAKAS